MHSSGLSILNCAIFGVFEGLSPNFPNSIVSKYDIITCIRKLPVPLPVYNFARLVKGKNARLVNLIYSLQITTQVKNTGYP